MKSIPISDGEEFRGRLRDHAADAFPIIEHLAEQTGILAGPDGERSRGIFCAPCRFGFRRDFGEFPVVEARTSLANDFADESHRRDCPHWKGYLDHPQAFFYARRDQPAVSAKRDSPEVEGHACERCGKASAALFRCLEKKVCFACLGEVMAFTDGYSGLKSLMTVEESPEEPASRTGRKKIPAVRCKKCRAPGTLVPIRGVGYCKSCATAEIEKLLAS